MGYIWYWCVLDILIVCIDIVHVGPVVLWLDGRMDWASWVAVGFDSPTR